MVYNTAIVFKYNIIFFVIVKRNYKSHVHTYIHLQNNSIIYNHLAIIKDYLERI